MPGDPWKNRKSVRICAFLDMIFAILVISVYALRLCVDNIDRVGPPRGFFRTGEKLPLTIALWTAAFSVNIVQFVIAYLLFVVVKQGTTNSDASIIRSKYWLVVSNAVFVMLICKLIYIAFFDKGNDSVVKVLTVILCIAELFFKGYGMYFVKEFLDDLKASYTAPQEARVQFMTFVNSRKTSNPNQSPAAGTNV